MNITRTIWIILGLSAISLGADVDTDHDNDEVPNMTLDALKNLFECVVSWKPCSETDASVKRQYPGVVLEACNKCTPRQKQNVEGILKRAEKEIPDLYKAYKDMFDPVTFKVFREALIA